MDLIRFHPLRGLGSLSEPFRGLTPRGFMLTPATQAKSNFLKSHALAHGFYRDRGAEAFVRTYGYADHSGIADRMNFGGVHKVGVRHATTNLELNLVGFDSATGKIRNADGRIALIDQAGIEAASWSFSSLLLHWNRKHNQACYVPSISTVQGGRQYRYGSNVLLGSGTDFQRFLAQMALGIVYYDPGIKLENMSTAPRTKRRSQFRIRSAFLTRLYSESEIADVATI